MPNEFKLDDVLDVLPGGSDLSKPGGLDRIFFPTKPAVATQPKADFSLDQVASVAGDLPKAVADFDLTQVERVESTPTRPGVYTLEQFRAKSADELKADKNFSPVDFSKSNIQNLSTEELDKVAEVYRDRETRGTTIKEKLSAFSNFPAIAKALGRGVVQAVKTSAQLNPVSLTKAAAEAAGSGSLEPLKRPIKSAAEAAASLELAGVGTVDLLRRSGRELREGAGKIVPGVNAKEDLSQVDWKQRLIDDAAAATRVEQVGQGNGAVMEALGVDADRLKQSGIVLNPEVIEDLSVVTDPVNYIPFGATVGFVGKIAGKAARGVIATTVSAEQAAKFAKILNSASEAAATARAVTGTATGIPLKAAGTALETTGQAAEKAVRAVGGTASGLGLGGILGHDIYSALGGAAVAKGGPAVLKKVGQATRAAGEVFKGERAVPASLALAGETVKGAAVGALKGAAEGTVLALPFELGARPEEEQNILGAAGLGGVIRGAKEGATPAAKATGRAAQERLAETIFRRVQQIEAPESPTYGTDPNLDSEHSANFATLRPEEQKLVNLSRELLRNDGGEIYVVNSDAIKRLTGQEASGYAVDVGEKIAPDRTATPLFRILLNTDAESLPHEFFHALEALDPKQAEEFRNTVTKVMTPEQKERFKQVYNSRINGGLPENQWTYRLTDEQVAGEVGAELFSRIFLTQDLSGVEPRVAQKASLFLSSILEKLGVPLAGESLPANRPGVSNLGLRPGTETVRTGQEWLANLIAQVDERGQFGSPRQSVLSVPERPSQRGQVGAIPAEVISRRPTTATTPKPITPVTTPTTPAAPATPVIPPSPPRPAPPATTARNIRTTRAAQNDFAGRRAEVTNTDRAREAAAKSGDQAVVDRVEQISQALESDTVTPFEIEHSGVRSVSTAEKPSGRTARRAEQEAAYIAEGAAAAPQSVREAYQKIFVPVRWETAGGKSPQLLAMSLDKVIANVHKLIQESVKHKVAAKIPYEIVDGKLTDNAWGQVVDDLKSYARNQQNGYRGDGQKLTRPTEDVGLSIPTENPAYNPVRISEERANFLNTVQGLNPPLTARTGRQSSAVTPGNVKGQILAEVNQRQPQTPSVIRPEDLQKQTFSSGRTIKETNPLRNELAAAGVPVRELIEVTERINAVDINSVTPRPDLDFTAPVTDTIRGGFSPGKATETALKNGQIPDPAPARVEGNEDVRKVASDYTARAGLDTEPHTGYDELPTPLAKKLADFYDTAKSEPDSPAVKASYEALVNETLAQYDAIQDAGYTIEPWTGEGEPYKSSSEMVADVRDNKHLYFLPTGENFSPNNPMLRPANRLLLGEGAVVNDVFRAVHDFFGHAKEGYQFGPRGEFNAWKSHSTMFTPEAQGALAAETLAQNAWVNFGPQLRDTDGNVARKGESSYVEPTKRPFAEQKNVVVPDSLIAEAKGTVDQPDGKFSPATESIDDFATRVIEAPNEEFVRIVDADGGLTKAAYKLGLNLTDKADVGRLQAAYERASAEGKRLMAAKDLDKAFSVIARAQFFREAFEAATDTGSASQPRGWRSSFPDREAPFPADRPEGSFSPTAAEFEARLKSGYYDKKSPQPKKKTSLKLATPTFWVLPDGEVRPLKGSFHEYDLASNSEEFNKKFGTNFSDDASEVNRLDALNKGFVRVRYTPNDGSAVAELNSRFWRGKVKSSLTEALIGQADKIDNLQITLLDDDGTVVDSVQDGKIFRADDRETAIQDLIREVKPPTTERNTQRGPTDIQRIRALPGNFSPERAGELFSLPEESPQTRIERRIEKARAKYPEALPLEYQKTGDKFATTPEGDPKPKAVGYDLDETPLAKTAVKGVRGEAERSEAVAQAYADRLQDVLKSVADDKEVQAGAKWYSTARVRLKKLLGDDSKVFAELLGATSARTPVEQNFNYSLDAYNKFKAGDYDAQIKKYREGKAKWDRADIGDFVEATGNTEPTRGQFLDWWVEENELKPRRSNGKLFSSNSRQVLHVLDGSWREEAQGPKTPNFAGNLSGDTFEATIDVWAARLLHRVGSEGLKKRWRILPENETGVSDKDFKIGQDAFRIAAKQVGMKPDALQAILWFAEKSYWEKNNWTRGTGAEKNDFNTLLAETERVGDKLKKRKPQLDLAIETEDIRKR